MPKATEQVARGEKYDAADDYKQAAVRFRAAIKTLENEGDTASARFATLLTMCGNSMYNAGEDGCFPMLERALFLWRAFEGRRNLSYFHPLPECWQGCEQIAFS